MRHACVSLSPNGVTDPFRGCVDEVFIKAGLVAIGLAEANATNEDIVRMYHNDPRAAAISPNQMFDELWYRGNNRDLSIGQSPGQYKSGFLHFINEGIFLGRWPNATLQGQARESEPLVNSVDDITHLAEDGLVKLFLQCFPVIDLLRFYNLFGRYLRLSDGADGCQAVSATEDWYRIIANTFDPVFYRQRYMQALEGSRFNQSPFMHYLVDGLGQSYSPNSAFDEEFYRAFYPEIRDAIEKQEIPCGYYHYVVVGRSEKRLPKYDRRLTLEARSPGVTRPMLLERVDEIRGRLRLPEIMVDHNMSRRLWVLLPTINPEITFGGYKSVFELMLRLHQREWNITIVCTEDQQADKHYYLFREESEKFRQLVAEVDFITLSKELSITVGDGDVVLVYSLWDLYAADRIRQVAPLTRVVLLAQEFEPIFYDNGAPRALIEEAYKIPHFPLINSEFLCRYFQRHKIGVFSGSKDPVYGEDYAIFQHRINCLPRQTASQMLGRGERLLVAYARPEAHAARNMFEILLLALQRLCEEHKFGPEWSFIGLGALTDVADVPLGDGHILALHPKMSEEQYTNYITAMDIGVSLMFAPHPSVVPFEFATTGAVVVTNVFENRSAEELAAISGNIVAGSPTVDGIADALRRALEIVPYAEIRARNAYTPSAKTWDDVFNHDLINLVFGH